MFAFKNGKKATASSNGFRNSNGGIVPPSLLEESRVPNFYKDAIAMCGAVSPNQLPNTASVYNLMVSSQLPRKTLGNIWSLVNRTHPGTLSREEFYACLALIALAQKGDNLSALCGVTTLPIPYLQTFKVNSGPAPTSNASSVTSSAQRNINDTIAEHSFPAVQAEVSGATTSPSQGQQSNIDLLMEIDFAIVPTSTASKAEPDTADSSLASISFPNASAGGPSEAFHADKQAEEDVGTCKDSSAADEVQPDPNITTSPVKKAREHEKNILEALEKCSTGATAIFDDVARMLEEVGSSSVNELLDTDKGFQLIRSLKAISLVLSRLRISLEHCGSRNKECQSARDACTAWTRLLAVPCVAKVLEMDDASPLAADCDSVCSVCVQPLTQSSISFLGHYYHSECANFWINNVSTMLPQL